MVRSTVPAADPGVTACGSTRDLWRALTPKSDFEAVYYNWFRVAPTLLFEVLSREDIPEHVRDLVLRRGVRDPTLDYDSVDEDFYNAMVGVTDP